MKMRKCILFFGVMISIGFCASAQINIHYNDIEINAATSSSKYVIKDGINISNEEVNKIKENEWLALHSNPISLKKTAQSIFLAIPLHKINKEAQWLVIKDPHINVLQVWIRKKNEIIKTFGKTGDHFPFKSRSILANEFVFPVSTAFYDSCELIIAADKRHTKKILPVFFYSDEQYIRHAQESSLLHGVLIGLSLILLIYNSYLYFMLRQRVFQWYSIYLLLILLYFLSDMGYLFEYLYPNFPEINDVLRMGIIAGSLIPFLLFINEMLELKKQQPLFYAVNKIMLLIFSLIFILGIISAALSGFELQQFWLNVYHILSPLIILIVTIESFVCMIRKVPFSIYTTLSLLSLILMSVIYLCYEKNWLPDNILTMNSIYAGVSAEIFIMTMAIAARFNSFKKSSETLQNEKNKQQEEIINTISEFKEKEMQRLSNLLHDSVGARLSAIRLQLDTLVSKNNSDADNMQIDFVAKDISALADEVRTFSHEISPLLLQKNGLIITIQQLIQSINKTGKLNIQFENIGSVNQVSFSTEIMLYNILHELIQNIIKHAEADFCIIQLMIEKEIISIFIEDNGKGFDPKKTNDGLGFSQIKKLIAFVDGSFSLDTSPNKGCKISIEFKNIDNE